MDLVRESEQEDIVPLLRSLFQLHLLTKLRPFLLAPLPAHLTAPAFLLRLMHRLLPTLLLLLATDRRRPAARVVTAPLRQPTVHRPPPQEAVTALLHPLEAMGLLPGPVLLL